jgi:hypothetical protein
MPVVVADDSTIGGSDSLSTEQCDGLIMALLCKAKLKNGCIGAVLYWGYLAIEKLSHSCPGMLAIWMLCTVLLPRGSGITNKIPLCKQHLVHFRKVST